jgi:hypothetical protein
MPATPVWLFFEQWMEAAMLRKEALPHREAEA